MKTFSLFQSSFLRITSIFLITTLIFGDPFIFSQAFAAPRNQTNIPKAPSPVIAPLPTVTGTMAGYLAGNFDVSERGSANYSIPLSVPPGIGGVAPQLSLSFDSQSSNGPLGMGWTLNGLSVITRCPTTLVQDGIMDPIDFDSNDKLCLDGQRLVAVNGPYLGNGTEYRMENEGFSKIISSGLAGNGPLYFTVSMKNGLIFTYGNSADSVLQHASGGFLVWKLNKVEDRFGNYFTVSYYNNTTTGENYPVRIEYAWHTIPQQNPYNNIDFEYEPRPDPQYKYVSGKRIETTQRLKKILMYADHILAWDYELNYQQAPFTNRSRLISIRQCDPNDICLAPVQLAWQNGNVGATADQVLGTRQFQAQALPGDPNAGEVQAFADMTGDSQQDIIYQQSGTVDYYMLRNTGTAFAPNVLWGTRLHGVATNGSGLPVTAHQWFQDMNGDGRADLTYEGWQYNRIYVKLSNSNGTGFGPDILWGQRVSPVYEYAESQWYADFNGDALLDYIYRQISGGYASYNVMLNTGTGFAPQVSWGSQTSEGNPPRLSFFDINGDGLADLVWNSGNQIRVLLTQATGGFGSSQVWGTTSHPVGSPERDTGYADFNGDSLPDYIYGSPAAGGAAHYYVKINTGIGFSPDIFWGTRPFETNEEQAFIDINGDGLGDVAYKRHASLETRSMLTNHAGGFGPDQLWAGRQGTSNAHEAYLDLDGDGLPDYVYNRVGTLIYQGFRSSGAFPDLLTRVDHGHGKAINIEYKTLTDSSVYTKENTAVYPAIDLQFPMHVVSAYEASNGIGGLSRLSFFYHGLKAEQNGRGFSGFKTIRKRDEQTGIATTNFYRQDHPFKTLLLKSETRLSDDTLIHKAENTWSVLNFANGTYFPYTSNSIESSYTLSGALIKTESTDRTYDDFGNVLTNNTAYSDGQSIATTNVYDNDTTNWILGRLRQANVTHSYPGVPSITRTSTFNYYLNGQLRDEIIEPNHPTLRLQKTYQYDVYGNIRFSTVSGSNIQTRISESRYDVLGRFAIQEINALGQGTNKTHNYATGSVTVQTDPNGLTTRYEYDSFNRLKHVFYPDGTESRTLYFLADSNSPAGAAYFVRQDSSGNVPTITYYDVLDREIRKETIGFNGQKIFVDQVYAPLGQVMQQSDPYFEGSTPQWTVNQYDILNRVLFSTQPGNHTTGYLYDQGPAHNEVVLMNPNNQTTRKTYNAKGQLIKAKDHNGSELVYVYDPVGNLIETRTISLVTQMQYDIRGNKTRIHDPDTGITTFAYNALGQLTSQTDALGSTTTYAYDLLGRMISQVSTDGTSTWVYDTAPYGIGRLASVASTNNFLEQYQYDPLGRLGRKTTRIDNVNYYTQNYFDQYSRPSYLVYPSNFAVNYQYNSLGYLEKILRADTGVTLWKTDIRNARGQLERQTFGNGMVTRQTYNAQSGYIATIQTGPSGLNNFQNLTFSFDNIGNLLQRADQHRGLVENFHYDMLNRLTDTQVVGGYNTNIVYDPIGNIQFKSDVGIYSYGQNGAGPHAVTSVAGTVNGTYSYDANGNRTGSNGSYVTYSFDNKPTVIDTPTANLRFSYAPDRRRFKQIKTLKTPPQQVTTKIYVGSIFERTNNGPTIIVRNYVFAGDSLVCMVERPSVGAERTFYMHKDHLGSVQTVTNQGGVLVEALSYDAWGQRRNANTWQAPTGLVRSQIDYGFTGHEHLDDVQLIHMNGRVYDPILGRFLSADPIIQAADNLQDYNRYSYVLNNPLSYTDPSGFFFKKFFRKLLRPFESLLRNEVASALFQVALLVLGGPYWAAGFQAINTFANGGSVFDVFKMIALQEVTAMAFNAVGGSFAGIDTSLGSPGYFAKTMAHGTVGGVRSVLSGGKFQHGFVSSAVAQAFAPVINEKIDMKEIRVIASAVIGGTASELGGGSFANGAITAAFARLYNDEQDHKTYQEKWRLTGNQKTEEFGTARSISDIGSVANVAGSLAEAFGRPAVAAIGGALAVFNIEIVEQTYVDYNEEKLFLTTYEGFGLSEDRVISTRLNEFRRYSAIELRYGSQRKVLSMEVLPHYPHNY